MERIVVMGSRIPDLFSDADLRCKLESIRLISFRFWGYLFEFEFDISFREFKGMSCDAVLSSSLYSAWKRFMYSGLVFWIDDLYSLSWCVCVVADNFQGNLRTWRVLTFGSEKLESNGVNKLLSLYSLNMVYLGQLWEWWSSRGYSVVKKVCLGYHFLI